MKILIMGLPGAGKTWLAERLQKHLNCAWYNADRIREMANDWDFSDEGRIRQAMRMKSLADFEQLYNKTVICDFVCPTNNTRRQFRPSVIIWLDTIVESRFKDTNTLFEQPNLRSTDIRITNFLTDPEIKDLADSLIQRQLCNV